MLHKDEYMREVNPFAECGAHMGGWTLPHSHHIWRIYGEIIENNLFYSCTNCFFIVRNCIRRDYIIGTKIAVHIAELMQGPCFYSKIMILISH